MTAVSAMMLWLRDMMVRWVNGSVMRTFASALAANSQLAIRNFTVCRAPDYRLGAHRRALRLDLQPGRLVDSAL